MFFANKNQLSRSVAALGAPNVKYVRAYLIALVILHVAVTLGFALLLWQVVRWTVADGSFALTREERDGPPGVTPTRQGSGTRPLQRSLAAELNGKVTLEFVPAGLLTRVVGSLTPAAGSGALDALER